MSLSNTTVKQIFTGNGSTDTFAIPFAIVKDASDEVDVYLRDETDPLNITETLKVNGVDYTLTGGNDNIAPFHTTVDFGTAPTSTQKVLIVRKTDLTQPSTYSPNGPNPAKAQETALDRLTAISQELNEQLTRTVQLKKSSPTTGPVALPEPEATYALRWNAAGTELENFEPVAAGAAVTSVNGEVGNVVLNLDDINDVDTTGVANGNVLTYDSGNSEWIASAPVGAVDSVNGATGTVVLDTDDINEGATNLYYTDARVDSVLASSSISDFSDVDTTGASNSQVLSFNGTTWVPATVAGTGDVVGPASATDNAIVRFDNTTGKLLQDSTVTVSDTGALAGVTQLDVDNIRVDGNTISTTNANGDLNITPNGSGKTIVGRLRDTALSTAGPVQTNSSGDLTSSATLPISLGGTGQATQTAAFDALSPTTTKGDLIVSNGTNNVRQGVGSDGQVLAANSAVSSGVEWQNPGGLLSGLILAYGGSSAPSGWLLCDGALVSRATYSALYSVVGNAFGEGDGSTTFALPDFRGRFLRGVDNGASRDPDAATRIAMATGGNTGDNVGSVQSGSFASHSHAAGSLAVPANDTTLNTTISPDDNGTRLRRTDIYTTAGAVVANSPILIGSSANTGGSETRPINAYVNYIIKT